MAQTNVYNGLDTRVGSTTNSVANTYLRNGAYVTAPVIKDSNATFTPGVSERRGTTTTFSHSGLKNADVQSSVSQAVNATQQYDAFGNLASSTGTWQGQFGYGGGFGYQQDATGLKLLGHRYYDSSTGRFLTRDPIKDGRNWYVYCDGDPLSRYDSAGLFNKIIHRIIWKGINSGALPEGTADRYASDKKFQNRIHREKEKRKIPSPEKSNPDASAEEIIEIVQDDLETNPPKEQISVQEFANPGLFISDADKILVGAVIVGIILLAGIATIGSGGTLAPAAGIVLISATLALAGGGSGGGFGGA